jgi:hypothetical protein
LRRCRKCKSALFSMSVTPRMQKDKRGLSTFHTHSTVAKPV